MPLTMSTLLIHDHAVPQAARLALQAATAAAPSDREALLESAARILYDLTDLECVDVRELVDLPVGDRAQARCGRADADEISSFDDELSSPCSSRA